ncbi:MAG: hypothetical protein J6U00_03285 [Ruminococcus sp.]|uniref:PF20097 family protein n=1 Tax=Ruminococcus sp. TaxID=41978 RepID=UPI001AFFCC2F|nr:PF20097 family protein [Ruminococcus sp.]MBO7473018.1 hypothetical protein [Ruminococcus sp.]
MDSKQVATIIKVYGGRLAMTCPYCNNEMEQGIIQSPHELSWKRGTKRPVLGRAEFHEGSVVLSKLSFMKGSAVVAYLCRECKKVIIDYSDEKADLNQR